jgi:hypothetical protein
VRSKRTNGIPMRPRMRQRLAQPYVLFSAADQISPSPTLHSPRRTPSGPTVPTTTSYCQCQHIWVSDTLTIPSWPAKSKDGLNREHSSHDSACTRFHTRNPALCQIADLGRLPCHSIGQISPPRHGEIPPLPEATQTAIPRQPCAHGGAYCCSQSGTGAVARSLASGRPWCQRGNVV